VESDPAWVFTLHACSNTTGAVRDMYGLYNWTTINYLSAYTSDYVRQPDCYAPHNHSTHHVNHPA
jgi:hypothetical protein